MEEVVAREVEVLEVLTAPGEVGGRRRALSLFAPRTQLFEGGVSSHLIVYTPRGGRGQGRERGCPPPAQVAERVDPSA